MRLNLVGAAMLMLVVGCAGPNASSPAASSAPSTAPTQPLSVTLADFKIQPSELSAIGQTISFAVMSNGPTPHNFTVRNAANERVGGTQDLRAGESTSLMLDLPAGDYSFFCALAGHESLGMRGSLTVTAP